MQFGTLYGVAIAIRLRRCLGPMYAVSLLTATEQVIASPIESDLGESSRDIKEYRETALRLFATGEVSFSRILLCVNNSSR
jgi:hypothetical protein